MMNLYTADEYERQAISAVLWHFSGAARVVDGLSEAGLSADDFRDPIARAVWTAARAICEESSMEIPTLAVVEWLGSHPEEMPDMPLSVLSLTTNFPSGAALPSDVFYDEAVSSIKRASRAQREVDRATRLVLASEAESLDPDEIGELADEIASEREAEQDRDAEGPVSGKDAIALTLAENKARQESGVSVGCVPTGYRMVDQWLDGGYYPGNLYVLAARPSVGKTALGLNCAVTAAPRSAVLVDSLEMPRRDVVVRGLSIATGIQASDIKANNLKAEQLPAMGEAIRMLGTDAFAIDDEGGMPLLDLCRRARVWFRRRKAVSGLLIVDYLQLVTVPERRGANRENEVSKVSATLKALAKRCNIPVLALCQLNRLAETAARPGLHHLRESGSIEQDADVVMILHRARVAEKGGAPELGNAAELNVAKNRNGPVGVAALTFDPPTNRFFDGRRVDDEDIPTRY